MKELFLFLCLSLPAIAADYNLYATSKVGNKSGCANELIAALDGFAQHYSLEGADVFGGFFGEMEQLLSGMGVEPSVVRELMDGFKTIESEGPRMGLGSLVNFVRRHESSDEVMVCLITGDCEATRANSNHGMLRPPKFMIAFVPLTNSQLGGGNFAVNFYGTMENFYTETFFTHWVVANWNLRFTRGQDRLYEAYVGNAYNGEALSLTEDVQHFALLIKNIRMHMVQDVLYTHLHSKEDALKNRENLRMVAYQELVRISPRVKAIARDLGMTPDNYFDRAHEIIGVMEQSIMIGRSMGAN